MQRMNTDLKCPQVHKFSSQVVDRCLAHKCRCEVCNYKIVLTQKEVHNRAGTDGAW